MKTGLSKFNLTKLFWTVSSILSLIIFITLRNDHIQAFGQIEFSDNLLYLVFALFGGPSGTAVLIFGIAILEIILRPIIAWLKK